jgi:hypothetical protein
MDKRLRRLSAWGTDSILGLDKDSEIDRSKLDLLSKPSEIMEVFSSSQRDKTLEQPSISTKWAKRLRASGMLSVRESTLSTSSGLCQLSAISINV